MARSGGIKISNNKGVSLISNNIPYGSYLKIKDGKKVKKGDILCVWDPYNAVILSEIKGKILFDSIEEGITFKEEFDEQTGHKEKVIVECRDKTKNPTKNPLMGWESSSDTYTELKLEFSSKELAINYAKKKKIDFELIEPRKRKTVKKSYADNFLK